MKTSIEISKKRMLRFLIVLITILVIAGIGLTFYKSNITYKYNGHRYHPGESFKSADGCNTCSFDDNGQMMCTLMACDTDDSNTNQLINISFNYHNDAYFYSGTIQKPTICHKVKSDFIIRESFPEQVDLRFTIEDSGEICAQVIGEEEISGQIPVSEKAKIQVYINDELQPGKGTNL